MENSLQRVLSETSSLSERLARVELILANNKPSQTQNGQQDPLSPGATISSDPSQKDPDHIQVVNVEVHNVGTSTLQDQGDDMSVTSVEEFLPEANEEPTNLNYQFLTNQLT